MTSHPLAVDLEHVLDHTRDLWPDLRGGRLFITGGTGFFGRWLLESLAWAHDRLGLDLQAVVLTRSPQAFTARAPALAQHACISLLQGDVRDFAFPEGSFTHLIHAASEATPQIDLEDRLCTLDSLVKGTRRALDFARTCGIQDFLLTSSGAVYGRQPPDLTHVPEDYPGAPDPLEPRSVYAQGKRMAEHLCSQYGAGAGLNIKIARGFAFLGPYLPLDAHYAAGNFIRDGLRGGPIIVQGDGTPLRSYLYAADLAIWLWTILLRGDRGRAYNVGSETSLSIRALAGAVGEAFVPTIPVQVLGTPNPDQPTERYVPSTARAQQELGLQAWIPLEEGIRRTIQFHRGRS